MLFGNTYLGSIHSFKFNDVHYDQAYNPEIDELLAGVTITLFGDTDGDGSFETQTVVSDATGEFGFFDLYPGLYTLSETVPTNMAPTTAPEFDVTVLSGQELVAYQGQAGELGPGQTEVLSTDPLLVFGNTFLGSIQGEKFNDQDQNGLHDAGEPLANGYTIQLIDTSSGLVIAEQVTRPLDLNDDGVFDPITEQGQYAFLNVFPGNYEIHEDLTNQGPETVQTFPLTPGFYTETVNPGETLLDRDFGNFSPIAKPDLIGHIDLAQLPDTFIPGDQVTIPLTVTNVGDAAASGRINIEIHHSSDTALGAEDGSPIGTVVNQTIDLAPGESIVIDVKSVIRADLTPGDYHLISSVDTTDVITDERSEANNIGASSDTITVGLLFGNIGDRSNVELAFTEADATEVTLTLAGGGTGALVFNQQFGVFDLVLDGTDDRTSISVDATGGDGRAQFGDIIINGAGIRSFSAANVDVLGDVIIDRFVNTLTLGNVLEDHEILIGTADDLTVEELAQSVTITLGNVEDTRIASAIGIKAITAVQWLDNGSWADTIIAPWIGTLDIDGDFEASLELSGEGDPKLTLGSANIGGDLSSGAAGYDLVWDITGDAGQIDASNGTVEDWFLVLHSEISSIALGLVESADLSIGDEDADGKRGDIGTLSVAQWNDGSILAGSIKSLLSSLHKNNSQTHGDFAADVTLTGPATDSTAKVTLGSAKIGGQLGSGDVLDPADWDITGEIGTIDASAGQTQGWTLATTGNVSSIKFEIVEQAALTIGALDADGKRADLGTLSVTQWNEGTIVAGSIKSMTTKQDSSIAGADGDFAADVELTGPALASSAKLTLGSAKFAGDLGSDDPQDPAVWDITGDIGTLDAASGTVDGFELELHSSIKTVNFGIVEDADLTIGDIDTDGHRGDAGTISAIAWRNGQIAAGSIKTLKISGDSKALIDGDFGASLDLTGSSDIKVKQTLGSASITNEVGSGNAVQPAIWAIDGPIGKLVISGQVDGWQLDLANADLSALTLGQVIHAQVNVNDGNIGAIKTTEWLAGGIATGTIKSLQTIGDKSSADINGDFGASLDLAGDAAFKLTLGSAKIGGDFGSPITNPVWDITGDVGAIDASNGTTDGWTLDVSGNLASLKLGLVEEADLIIGDTDADGKRGDAGTISASQWNDGSILAGSIKTLDLKANSSVVGADGDFGSSLALTGPGATSSAKGALGSAKIAGDVGSQDPTDRAIWSIAGDLAVVTISGGANGWQLDLAGAGLKTLSLNRVADAQVNVLDGGIGTIKSVEWLAGGITTRSIGVLQTTGDSKIASVDGSFGAALNLTGDPDTSLALGNVKIAGDLGSTLQPVLWSGLGDAGSIDASGGNVNNWSLELDGDIAAVKLGVVGNANLSIGTADADGRLGDIGTLSALQWDGGHVIAGSIKSLSTSANAQITGAEGDFNAKLTLTGPQADSKAKQTLASAKIAGDMGAADRSVIWDVTGDIGSIDATGGQVNNWALALHSNIASLKFGIVENASLTIGDEDADGNRGDIGSIIATQWSAGEIVAGSIKSLSIKLDSKTEGANGDFGAGLELTGPATGSKAKDALGAAAISGTLGTADALAPSVWDIEGSIGSIDTAKGTVDGWTLEAHASVKTIKLGLVEQADLTFGDEDGNGNRADVSALSVTQFNDGTVRAGSIKSLSAKADSKIEGADGDFNGDLILTGSSSSKVKQTLGAATITGRISGAFWDILAGDISAITAGIIENSTIRAGIDPSIAAGQMPTEDDDYTDESKIDKVTLKGVSGQASGTPTFMNSVLAAWQLGSLKLNVVQGDNSANGNAAFGLAADSISSVAADKEDGTPFPKLTKLKKPADVPAFDFGDFTLVLVD